MHSLNQIVSYLQKVLSVYSAYDAVNANDLATNLSNACDKAMDVKKRLFRRSLLTLCRTNVPETFVIS